MLHWSKIGPLGAVKVPKIEDRRGVPSSSGEGNRASRSDGLRRLNDLVPGGTAKRPGLDGTPAAGWGERKGPGLLHHGHA
jgi:hypothetical protein